MKPRISLIAALDENNAIGYRNQLMWNLPDDFKWFKRQTVGKPNIMGRNTMSSLGKPLKDRLNIVLSSSSENIIEGFTHASSLDEAMALVPPGTEEVMIIGGGVLFRETLAMADRLYITRIHHRFEADTYFPQWEPDEWEQTFFEHHGTDERHLYEFDFMILDRKR